MKVRRLTMQSACALIAVLAFTYTLNAQHHESSREDKKAQNALVKVVREATERFRDVSAAEAAGYDLMFGCVSGPDGGAMGLHYVNLPLVFDGELDPARFGLPAFYTLHVWAWKDSPTGTFVNWHSKVSCDAYSGPNQ